MKNKKLFAILTLVCFMFTLMPVAAFAADPDPTLINGSLYWRDNVVSDETKTGLTSADGKTTWTFTQLKVGASDENGVTAYKYCVAASTLLEAGEGAVIVLNNAGTATYKVTASDIIAANSKSGAVSDSLSAIEANVDAEVAGEAVNFDVNMYTTKNNLFTGADDLYVWVTKDGSNVPVDTVEVFKSTTELTATNGYYVVTGAATAEDVFKVIFNAEGTYRVHASVNQPTMTSGTISNASEFDSTDAVVEVSSTSSLKVEDIRMDITAVNVNATALEDGDVATIVATDGTVSNVLAIEANNVEEKTVTIKLYDKNGKPLQGKTVEIATVGAIETSTDSVKTSVIGKAEFGVSGSTEGTYKVYISYGNFEVVLEVQVGATAATTIKCTEEPTNPIDILGTDLTKGIEDIEFTMYDVNGNEVNPTTNTLGWTKAADSYNANAAGKDLTGYVSIVEQPAASKLANKNLKFNGTTIVSNKQITAEGTYTFKVVLDNGAYATATIEVKEFTTPVMMYMELADVVELGKTVAPVAKYVDANKVTKVAKDAEFTATGYAVSFLKDGQTIEGVDAQGKYIWGAKPGYATIGTKTDEKYAGQTFTVTAVSERYNLVATKEVKIANEGTTVKFVDTNLAVGVNNKVAWYIADAEGNKVRLNDADFIDAKYVVLDAPEDAKVSVTNSAAIDNGEGEMSLTSNKVGNVTVQIIVQYKLNQYSTAGSNQLDNLGEQTKYYTATKVFAVGTNGTGDVVVMSIGSNEIVINDAKATIDAAPIVENNRTFVPFRALAEAFGATVAYDEATQAVTAELNGVTVVMTIGSAEYTVNGEAKTADVAPFINGSRTMVPVRFAAEAFGIKVIPTYDENGATADILFNL